MTDTLAQHFGALVIFAEHRYFGESMPYGTESLTNKAYYNQLTAEQAMLDYVELIKFVKQQYNLYDRAVIACGGSYGGMLASWMRMKYPNWIQGAYAASAPILSFDGYVDPYAWNDIATGVYE